MNLMDITLFKMMYMDKMLMELGLDHVMHV